MSQPANDEFSQHLSDDKRPNMKMLRSEGGVLINGLMEVEANLEYIDKDILTAAEIQAVKKERKAKNILLMAIPKEHMRRFHGISEGLEKGYDIFQQLLSQLEAHGAEVSKTEDANS
ncbi:hypothetical protein Tco_0892787 [Tanacetum coccineum]|uniref:Uncharacterized protein n=1 Tax=Tanacetum coccineum TaxID=301880 RepID=A0ABQ5C793_9ASTR